MLGSVIEVRDNLQSLSAQRAPESQTGDQCVRVLRELGVVRRLVDGLVAATAARAEATAAHRGRGDRSAADLCAKSLGASANEGAGMVAAGKAAAKHAPIADAVRSGSLTAEAAALIGETLEHAPDATKTLMEAAKRGREELRDACMRERANAEDPAERARRQQRLRSLRTWTDAGGMFCGRFSLTPEIGGQIKALIDEGVQRKFRERRASGEHEPHEAYAADVVVELILNEPEETDAGDAGDAPGAGETRAQRAAGGDRTDDEDATRSGATQGSDGTGEVPSGEVPTGDEHLADSPRQEGRGHDEALTEIASLLDPPSPGCGGATNREQRRAHTRTQKLARRGTKSRVQATVHIVIDHAALVRGEALAGERCEIPGVGPVHAEWVRDLLGDAFLTAVIARGTDIHTVVHFGRHINAKLRTALLVQGRECDVDGCGARGYLEIDHERDHGRGNPTALCNLGYFCAHHHRLKTAGWILGPRHPETRKRTLTAPRPPAAAA